MLFLYRFATKNNEGKLSQLVKKKEPPQNWKDSICMKTTEMCQGLSSSEGGTIFANFINFCQNERATNSSFKRKGKEKENLMVPSTIKPLDLFI